MHEPRVSFRTVGMVSSKSASRLGMLAFTVALLLLSLFLGLERLSALVEQLQPNGSGANVDQLTASGQLGVDKTTSVSVVSVGEVYTYSVFLTYTGNPDPSHAIMTDVLPSEAELVGGPTVTELSPTVNPLMAYFMSHIGPNGAVGWQGTLSPDAAVRIDFRVKVKHCPQPERDNIRNVAVARQVGGDLAQQAVTETFVECDPPPEPHIELDKGILTDVGEPETAWATVPGQPVIYHLSLHARDQLTHTVHISDPMQRGAVAVAADASSGVAQIVNGGRVVVWDGGLGAANSPVIIRIEARLQEIECGGVVENVAYWFISPHAEGTSNGTRLELVCHDLGDAPTSLNHFDVDMVAYPGVAAIFPTVFDTAPVPGPLHLRSQPLHLGSQVSLETQADQGVDLDGVNNIEPRSNKSDQDKADDSLELDKLNFVHCETHRFPVWISVDHRALAALGQDATAYINVWLDSNRDGDWNDVFTKCPGQQKGVFEHIVIDWPVDVAALGPGQHRIFVETNLPVSWPDDLGGKPAWLRVTLGEKKSNKTLPESCTTAPDCLHGDGRGYELGFELGETEDYLLRGPDQPTEADPTVKKRGRIHPHFYFESQDEHGKKVWKMQWWVHYWNYGGTMTNDVQVVDTFDPRQELVTVHAHPSMTPTVSGNTLTFTVGVLGPGHAGTVGALAPKRSGHIFIRTSVPFTTPPGTVLTNTVIITASDDGHPGNNRQVVTVTVPLLPPLITYPRPGTTCNSTFTVTGQAQPPGVDVEVLIGETAVATVTADAEGWWSHPFTLPDGTYPIQARARYGNLVSQPSPPVKVIVDSSLPWSPLSLRFISEKGSVIWPKDGHGRADEHGWFVFLRPGKTYTVTVFVCCTTLDAAVTLQVPGGQGVELEDPDGDGWYEGTFTMPWQVPGSSSVVLCVTCDNVQYCSDGRVLIDPEGVVFDVTQGQQTGLLEDAVVACYKGQTSLDSGDTTYNLWPAEAFGQENPQMTAADGYFSFFTPAGTYRLDVARENYQSFQSWGLVVVDEPVEFDVPLTPEIADEADYVITISETGFDPPALTVEIGAIVEWVNVGGELHTATSVTPTARVEELRALNLGHTQGWDSGLLESGATYKRRLFAPGTYVYYDHENPVYTGLVVVEAQSQLYLPLVLKGQ